MELYDHMLGKLDEMTFLGFKVWDFSLRSLSHRYGTAFLQEDERTSIQEKAYRKVLDFLDGVAEIRGKLGNTAYRRFQRERNIYVPE